MLIKMGIGVLLPKAKVIERICAHFIICWSHNLWPNDTTQHFRRLHLQDKFNILSLVCLNKILKIRLLGLIGAIYDFLFSGFLPFIHVAISSYLFYFYTWKCIAGFLLLESMCEFILEVYIIHVNIELKDVGLLKRKGYSEF